jgi:hypothetical protein
LLISLSLMAFLYCLNMLAFCLWLAGHPMEVPRQSIWIMRAWWWFGALVSVPVIDIVAVYLLMRKRRPDVRVPTPPASR